MLTILSKPEPINFTSGLTDAPPAVGHLTIPELVETGSATAEGTSLTASTTEMTFATSTPEHISSMDKSEVKSQVFVDKARSGQYQRADVTLFDRLQIASRFYNPLRPWGEVTILADQYGLSRVTIYKIAHQIRFSFEPRLPGPVASPEIDNSAEISSPASEKFFSDEQAAQLVGRLILTSVFPGGMTMRPTEELLAQIPGLARSDSTIWRLVNQAGKKANQILGQINYSNLQIKEVLVAIDETFFDDWPILFVVEPTSLAICGFHVSADGNHSSFTWDPLMLCLKENKHLNITGGMADGAKYYPTVFKNLLKNENSLQGDHFHVRRDLKKLESKLENKAYRLIKTEEEAQKKDLKESTAESQQKLAEAKAACEQALNSVAIFSEAHAWIIEGFKLVDYQNGEIRDHKTNELYFDFGLEQMEQLKDSDVVSKCNSLINYKHRLFTYLNSLEKQLPLLQSNLLNYLDDVELVKAVEQDAARYWWCSI